MNLKFYVIFISLFLVGCEDPFGGGRSSGGRGVKAESKARNLEIQDRLGQANQELTGLEGLGGGKFSSFNSSLPSLEFFDSGLAKRQSFVSDGGAFYFQCTTGTGEQKQIHANRFARALKDFDNNAKLLGVLLNIRAYEDIRSHAERLKQIPVDVAREAFLKALNDENLKRVVLPKGAKEDLRHVRHKYDLLMNLKQRLREISTGNAANEGIEKRKEGAANALDAYNDYSILASLDNLKDLGADDVEIRKALEKPLELSRVIEFNSLVNSGAGGQAELNKRNQLIQETITRLESEVESQLKGFVAKAFRDSGNRRAMTDDQGLDVSEEYVENFFHPENAKLLEDAIEVTGWEFNSEMEYNLLSSGIDSLPQLDRGKVFDHIKGKLEDQGGQEELASSMNFFKNYEKLQEYKKDTFFMSTFGRKMHEIEQGFQLSERDIGEISSMRNYLRILCEGRISCSVADVYVGSLEDNASRDKLFRQLLELAGLQSLGSDEVTLDMIKGRLLAIKESKNFLVSQFGDCNALVTDNEIKRELSSVSGDYVKCDVLKDVLSEDGYQQLCADATNTYASGRSNKRAQGQNNHTRGANGQTAPVR